MQLLGLLQGVLNALTNQPFSIARLIPFKRHGQLELPFVPGLILLPAGDRCTASTRGAKVLPDVLRDRARELCADRLSREGTTDAEVMAPGAIARSGASVKRLDGIDTKAEVSAYAPSNP